MTFEIRILGRVDALVDGGPLPLGGSKQRSVLAMLALRANRTVSADELIDGLWGERPPASAAKNLQLYVSRLRKTLDAKGEARIVTRGRGYELQLPEESVDAVCFERLVERASRESDQGIVDGAAQGALDLWRGAPLANVAKEPFAAPEIRRLEELRLRAIELAIDAELAAGRHGEIIGRLETLLAEHPLNERLHAQHMLALYRAGRQAQALEAYRNATRLLLDQIGVPPGPDLRRLEERIRTQDPELDPPTPREELPPHLQGGSPVLAGRERELAWLRKRWEEAKAGQARVALVSGPAGIGKTRLAAELALDAQRDGAAVVYAAGAATPSATLDSVHAVGRSERRILLVLDDADDAPASVLEAAAELVGGPGKAERLIVALHQDEQGPPALAALEPSGVAQRLALGPLPGDSLGEIAALYSQSDGMAMPLETLIAECEGVPLRAHRAASDWAQTLAAERLSDSVGRAAAERGDLHGAEAELTGSVVELQVARERARSYADMEPLDPLAPDICPFRGLAPFDSAHADYFFGRERLVASLVARVVGSTLLTLVGPSGSGKSSVLRAGLLPALANGVLPGSERWRQVVLRPGQHPPDELVRALEPLAPHDSATDGSTPLLDAIDSLGPEERLVLAVDQFEETFVACRDEPERVAFAEALAEAAGDPDQRVVVILAVRADFYGRFAEYPELASLVSANDILVGPMRRDELRRAIELPARRAGLGVEPRLVSALVGDVADQPGGLPLLSTTLVELWETRSARRLSHSAYESSGGVDGAVARLAERTYQRLTEPERKRARALLLRLADVQEATLVRRRVPLAELELDRDENVAAALAAMVESRLLTVDEGAVEVAHEALLLEWPRLRKWLEEDAEGRRLHRHLTQAAGEWLSSGRDPGELYRGARLATTVDWARAHDHDLNDLEREFLSESHAASEREAEGQRRTNRRLTALLAGVGILLAAAVIAGVIARSERQGARNAATEADAQRLGAEALNAERLDDALELATAGIALDDSLATRSSLLETLLRSPAAFGVLSGDGDPLNAIALSPDGRTLAIGDADGTVHLFNAQTRAPIAEYQGTGPVVSLAFDPYGDSRRGIGGPATPASQLLAVAHGTGQGSAGVIQLLSTRTALVHSTVLLGRHPASSGRKVPYVPSIVYVPGERGLVVTYSGGEANPSLPTFAQRFDPLTGAPLGKPVEIAPRSASTAPLFSPTGQLLVATDQATYALDAETLGVVRRYPVVAVTAAIDAAGATLAIGTVDSGLRLLDLASGRIRALGRSERDSVQEVGAFSPDGRALSTLNEDGGVVIWDVRRGREIETLGEHAGESPSQVFSPDGRTLYTAGVDSTAVLWDVSGEHRLGRPFSTRLRGIEQAVFPPRFAVSPDGTSLAIARLDGRVDLIDAETLHRTGSFEAFKRTPVLAVEYSPDGRRLAVAGGRGLLGIWDAESGEPTGPLVDTPPRRCTDPRSMFQGPRCELASVQGGLAFGSNELLATASLRGDVKIRDLVDGQQIREPLIVPRSVTDLAFNPDGSRLAIPFGRGSQLINRPLVDAAGRVSPITHSNGIDIRDTASGERVARLDSDVDMRSAAFSPDGRLLVSGQGDGSALLWDTDTWGRVGRALVVGRGPVIDVQFAPDGRTVAAASEDGTVGLWDVTSQQPIGSALLDPVGRPVTTQFTPDSRRLFAIYDNGSAVRWEVDPEAWTAHACAVAGGGLSQERWEQIVPEQDFRQVCPE